MRKHEKVAAGGEQKGFVLDRQGERNTRIQSQIARPKAVRPHISPLSEDRIHRLYPHHHGSGSVLKDNSD
jgi:hypothetical protein